MLAKYLEFIQSSVHEHSFKCYAYFLGFPFAVLWKSNNLGPTPFVFQWIRERDLDFAHVLRNFLRGGRSDRF